MSTIKKDFVVPDADRFAPQTRITPEQIENATGEERERLIQQQIEQLREIHNQNFLKRMLR